VISAARLKTVLAMLARTFAVMARGLGIIVWIQTLAVAFTPQVLLVEEQELNPLNLMEQVYLQLLNQCIDWVSSR
jgi:hypothetical protein